MNDFQWKLFSLEKAALKNKKIICQEHLFNILKTLFVAIYNLGWIGLLIQGYLRNEILHVITCSFVEFSVINGSWALK